MEEAEEEVGTQSQHELTQLVDVDDDIIGSSPVSGSAGSPATMDPPPNPLELPWGRLIPCGGSATPAGAAAAAAASAAAATRGAGDESLDMDLLPRPPADGADSDGAKSNTQSAALSAINGDDERFEFLGLRGLKRSDRFNEYILGRSAKCDVVARKKIIKDDEDDDNNDKKTNRPAEWVHAMISNRHCRLFCLLKTNGSRTSLECPSIDMEVYIEDSSGNGTLVNQSTLLHRGERRLLHTGDEICLVNPGPLRKRIRSSDEIESLVRHYSYIFVNVYQQRIRHHVGPSSSSHRFFASAVAQKRHQLNNDGDAAKRRGVVDVRATTSKPGNFDKRHPPGAAAADMLPPPPRRSPNNSPKGATERRISPPPQQRIEEHYDIRDLLGSGTCGDVRRAIHRRTGVERAVKIISTPSLGGGRRNNRGGVSRLLETDASVLSEAALLRKLDHPYIVRLLDVFVAPGTAIYLVMEMLHGGDLFDRIVSKDRYTEVESRRITRRMLAAVHYLHGQNIVHRDLKPENILCVSRTDDINVKLTDFGLAKALTNEGLKTFCGTPQYFAPEVMRRRHTVAGRGRYGKEADMWSLGIILYILLCGYPPFDATESMDAVANIKVQFRGDKWGGISSQAKDMVRKLLVADPPKRLSAEEACRHEWILMDDGDTHCHPLEDPTLPTKANPKSPPPPSVSKKDMDSVRRRIPFVPTEASPSSVSSSPQRRPPPQSVLASGILTPTKKLQFHDTIATNSQGSDEKTENTGANENARGRDQTDLLRKKQRKGPVRPPELSDDEIVSSDNDDVVSGRAKDNSKQNGSSSGNSQKMESGSKRKRRKHDIERKDIERDTKRNKRLVAEEEEEVGIRNVNRKDEIAEAVSIEDEENNKASSPGHVQSEGSPRSDKSGNRQLTLSGWISKK